MNETPGPREVLSILLFHGVVEDNVHYDVRNYNRKHIPKQYFAGVLERALQLGTAVSMDDVLTRYCEGEPPPPRAFAVTFDDGFENNYSVAAPILRDLNVPATFYVTSQFVDANAMSWIDRIEWAFERPDVVSVHLPWRKDVATASTPAEKIALLDEIRQVVKRDTQYREEDVVQTIFSQTGLDEIAASEEPIDRKMTWAQVAEISGNDLFIVGGHSHTHSVLSSLTRKQLNAEIDTSLRLISNSVGGPLVHYSYPEGLAHCYSQDVIDALKARGIRCCPTAIEGANAPGADPFHLRRSLVT